MKKILITGALGQIGSELSVKLGEMFGKENVIISDLRDSYESIFHYEKLDITNLEQVEQIVAKHKITDIYHLAALLSATGEKDPNLCWHINMNGTLNVLNTCVKYGVKKVFVPSSIAVWGGNFQKDNTPQDGPLYPSSMYGVTKVAGEVLADYYTQKYGIDCRGLRYPGIISSVTLPGGGTTDYAVEIFYEAVKKRHYNCFLSQDTYLPMMYMPDCVKATIDLMEADFSKLKNHSNFNLAAVSFSPAELANEIKKHIPEFSITYTEGDPRQAIANSWPRSVDDSQARNQWGWKHSYGLEEMVADMVEKIKLKLNN